MFSLLKFTPHHIPNAIHALYKFQNNYSISVVSGPDGSALYGRIQDETYEILIIYPNDETGAVIGWQTKNEVSAIMWAISQVK